MEPRWSREGKELYYLSGSRMMVDQVQTTPTFSAGLPQELFTAPIAGQEGGAPVRWDLTPDGKRFVIVTDENASSTTPLTVILNWQAGLRR